MIYDSTDMTFRIIDWIFIVDNRSVAFFFLVIKPLYFAWTTIIEVVLSRRVCNTDLQRHIMVCILMDANFEIRYTFLRTQSFGKRLNDDDRFHFSTIPLFAFKYLDHAWSLTVALVVIANGLSIPLLYQYRFRIISPALPQSIREAVGFPTNHAPYHILY